MDDSGRVVAGTYGKRRTTEYVLGERSLTATRWAREPDIVALGISASTLSERVKSGWSVRDALTTPRGGSRGSGAPARAHEGAWLTNSDSSDAAPASSTGAGTGVETGGSLALLVLVEKVAITERELSALRRAANVIARDLGADEPFPGAAA